MTAYIPPVFAVSDVARLHAFLEHRTFVTVIGVRDGEPVIGHAPLVLDRAHGALGAVRLHLARTNPLAACAQAGARLTILALGPDAYISPDWYVSPGQVPTWNYVAVYGAGPSRMFSGDELRAQADALSAAQEETLRPKPPWTSAKLVPGTMDKLMAGLAGIEIVFDMLQGKAKLSQNKRPEDVAAAAGALESLGDPASAAVAALMLSPSS